MGTDVWLAIVSALLTLNFGMGAVIWNQFSVRMTKLEGQNRMLCAVLISSTIQLHPDRATEVMQMMEKLVANGKG
jgi:hypothetical protein